VPGDDNEQCKENAPRPQEPEDVSDLPELVPVEDDELEHLPELLPVEDAEPEAAVIASPADDVEDLPELEPADELEQLPELLPVDDTDAFSELLPAEASDAILEDPPADGEVEGASYRKLYEAHFRGLPRDARIDRAHAASGDMLLSLCLDPEPGVISAVLENIETGLRHARLIADHHGNPVGLEAMGRRAGFLQDAAVRRLLMRNIQSSEALLRRTLGLLALPLVFRSNMSHENSERARHVARDVLREKFTHASAEQRVALLLRTEGRCLALMPGITFDQKTTALLCSKSYQSTLLVQSLARFPALPPNLIAVLLKQPLVLRSPHLKKLVLQHKNCPSSLKR
jgi:hypothetical protein